MFIDERRKMILKCIADEGRVEVNELAETFGVSVMTIRRDLKQLEQKGFLTRTWGGAIASEDFIDEIPYKQKAMANTELKQSIAKIAVKLVNENDSVILDAGSTTLEIAKILKSERKYLTVVTNDLKIALELADTPHIKVYTTGGYVQSGVYCLMGDEALSFLRSINSNIAFIGAGAIDVDAGVYTPTMEKAHLKRAMIQNTATAVLVADHTKFGRQAFAKVCEIEQFDVIITNECISNEIISQIEDRGVKTIMASTPILC